MYVCMYVCMYDHGHRNIEDCKLNHRQEHQADLSEVRGQRQRRRQLRLMIAQIARRDRANTRGHMDFRASSSTLDKTSNSVHMNVECGKFNHRQEHQTEFLVLVVTNSRVGSAGSLCSRMPHAWVNDSQGHMDFLGCKFFPRQDHQEGRGHSLFP